MTTDKINYTASLDLFAKSLTIGTILLFGFIITLEVLETSKTASDEQTTIILSFAVPLLLAVLLIIAIIYAPRSYSLTDKQLIIHRWAGYKMIPLQDIQSAQHIESKKLRWSWRKFGVGGFFGYYGKFYNSKFGTLTYFATQLKNFVMIELKNGKKIILTPDDISLVQRLQDEMR